MARPRDAEIDQAVMRAVYALLERAGYEALSMSAIAAEAKVSRAALYRRWPNKAELCFDAVFGPAMQAGHVAGGWREALTLTVRELSRRFGSIAAQRAIPGLLSAHAADNALELRVKHELLEPAYRAVQRQLTHGREAGALIDFDDTLFIDMMFGAVFVRAGVLGRPLDDRGAEQMVALLLNGVTHENERTGTELSS